MGFSWHANLGIAKEMLNLPGLVHPERVQAFQRNRTSASRPFSWIPKPEDRQRVFREQTESLLMTDRESARPPADATPGADPCPL